MRVKFVITPVTFENNDTEVVDDLSEKEIDKFLAQLEAFVHNHYLARIDIYKTSKFPKKQIGIRLL